MYGYSIGKFQFFQLLKRIVSETAILKFHSGSLCKFIDFLQNASISIKYAHPFFYRNSVFPPDFPFQLIVVPNLHNLVSLTEKPVSNFFLFFT